MTTLYWYVFQFPSHYHFLTEDFSNEVGNGISQKGIFSLKLAVIYENNETILQLR